MANAVNSVASGSLVVSGAQYDKPTNRAAGTAVKALVNTTPSAHIANPTTLVIDTPTQPKSLQACTDGSNPTI